MIISKYCLRDTNKLFQMMKNEGTEWQTYYSEPTCNKYKEVLEQSITYLLFDDEIVCGYIRCRRDGDFGLYILDLLVDKEYRGQRLGKQLIDKVAEDYPDDIVYVTSDADPYYEKQGFVKVGSVLCLK